MEFTARMIADLTGGKIDGDANATVGTFAKIEEGKPGALSFLANPKYTHHIYTTESSVVLVKNGFVPEREIKATLIYVDDPYSAISLLMAKVEQILAPQPAGIEEPSFIADDAELGEGIYVGAFAYVGHGAKIGKNVKIYPQAYVGDNVVIGDNTVLYPGVRIYRQTRIGKFCIIHAGAVIGADGFGFAPQADGTYTKIPQLGNVELGDFVEIGANTTIDRATMGSTKIGNGTKLDNLIQIAHNVTVGHDTVVASQTGVAGSAHIGDNCVIAGQVGVAGHITVGHRVTVGAQSGIPNNVADDSKIMGYPALPGGAFARQTAYLRRLPELFERVSRLENK